VKIVFRGQPNLNALCLVQARPGGRQPLVFDFNIHIFQGESVPQYFKFVYLKAGDRLFLGPDDMSHKKIATEALLRIFGRDELAGAFLRGKEENGVLKFALYDKSGYFGRPSAAVLRKIAEHIAARLDNAVITEGEEWTIEGRLLPGLAK
jgi:hypothetical protein